MSAYTDKVRPCTLRSGLSAIESGGRSFEESSHLCFMYLKKKNNNNRACHKLLLVSGHKLLLALTRSYSERWQVARIGLCGLGAVCGELKISNCPLAARASTFDRIVLLQELEKSKIGFWFGA